MSKKRKEAWYKILCWERRYPNNQQLIDFLVADAYVHSRSPGKKALFREYLSLPRQPSLFFERQYIPLLDDILPELEIS